MMRRLTKCLGIVALLCLVGACRRNPPADAEMLFHAADEGDLSTVQSLVERGVDVNASGELGLTALHAAAIMGRKEVVEFLLAKGANINATDEYGATPLCWAIGGDQYEVVRLLMEQGADVNTATVEGETPLWAALTWDEPNLAEFLIARDAEVDTARRISPAQPLIVCPRPTIIPCVRVAPCQAFLAMI